MPMGTFMRKHLVRGGIAGALLAGLAVSAAAQDISENTVKAFMN